MQLIYTYLRTVLVINMRSSMLLVVFYMLCALVVFYIYMVSSLIWKELSKCHLCAPELATV
jgi:uncharacterized membrane protein